MQDIPAVMQAGVAVPVIQQEAALEAALGAGAGPA